MATVPDFVGTGSEAARIHAVIDADCRQAGLPWNEIFSSMGDEVSPLRSALLEVLASDFCKKTVVLNEGECSFVAFHPNPHITFAQGRAFALAAKLNVLSLAQIGSVTGLKTQLRMDFPKEWRLVDFTYEQEGGKYHVAQVDRHSRHVQTDEYFGPDDVFIVKFEPLGAALRLTDMSTERFLAFEVISTLQIADLYKELARYGCVEATTEDILPLRLPVGMKVVVRETRGAGRYASFNTANEPNGWCGSSCYLNPGVIVFGKRYPNK